MRKVLWAFAGLTAVILGALASVLAFDVLFDRFIMISPALPQGAPTIRPDTGGWVSVAKPRIIVLAILNRLGIDWFNGLPIVAFATSPTAPNSPASIRSGSRWISARRAII